MDTGAIYRSIGWYVLQRGAALDNAELVAALLPDLNVEVRYGEDGLQHMVVNGQDVTDEIRSPEVSAAASQVAAIPAVRAYLLDMQRNLARTHNVIMDGRDIGTVVLPEADCKVFLTASDEGTCRAPLPGIGSTGYAGGLRRGAERYAAAGRERPYPCAAPLRQAEDAVVLDTSELDLKTARKRCCV